MQGLGSVVVDGQNIDLKPACAVLKNGMAGTILRAPEQYFGVSSLHSTTVRASGRCALPERFLATDPVGPPLAASGGPVIRE
jgi:hypothetical protein